MKGRVHPVTNMPVKPEDFTRAFAALRDDPRSAYTYWQALLSRFLLDQRFNSVTAACTELTERISKEYGLGVSDQMLYYHWFGRHRDITLSTGLCVLLTMETMAKEWFADNDKK